MDLGLRVALVTRVQQLAGGTVEEAWSHIDRAIEQRGVPTEDKLRDWLAGFDADLDVRAGV